MFFFWCNEDEIWITEGLVQHPNRAKGRFIYLMYLYQNILFFV